MESDKASYSITGVLEGEPAFDKYFETDERLKGTTFPTNEKKLEENMITFFTKGKLINIIDEIEKEDKRKQPGEDTIIYYNTVEYSNDKETLGISLSDILAYIMKNKEKYLGDNDEFIILDLTCNATFRESQTVRERKRHNPIIRGTGLDTPKEKGGMDKVRGIPVEGGQDETPYEYRKKLSSSSYS